MIRQELSKAEWDELTEEQKKKFDAAISHNTYNTYFGLPKIGHLIEFLHSTGYDWEVKFQKLTILSPPGDDSNETEENVFQVRLSEEGLMWRDEELIFCLWKATKEALKK